MDRNLEEALELLGVPPDTDHGRLTRAYRRLARTTHPDVSPESDAAERFALLTAAYRLVAASSDHARGSGRSAPSRAPSAWSGRRAGGGPVSAPDLDRPGSAVGTSPFLRPQSRSRPPLVAGPVMFRPAPGDVGTGEA